MTYTPGTVFDRLASPCPQKAVYFYGFRAHPPFNTQAVAAALKETYGKPLAALLYDEAPSPLMRFLAKRPSRSRRYVASVSW
jgi:hypothetical protein